MFIHRDYSQPFFTTRRRNRVGKRFVFLYLAFLVGVLVFVFSQQARLQLVALDALGIAPTPTPFASWFAEQGYDLYSRGELLASVEAFAQAVQQQPDKIDYIYEYGRKLIELGRPADAANGRSVSDYEMASQLGDHAIQVAPADPRSYALKGNALVWLDDAASAIPIALQGKDVDPNFAPLYSVLARAYSDIARYNQAIDNGQIAVDLDPNDPDTHRSLAIALINIGLRDEAIQQLEQAVSLNPYNVAAYFELAGQYKAKQLYEEAVATYERILTLEPRNAKALLRMCETFSQVGEDRQAEGYCVDALDVNDAAINPSAYRQLGMVNYRRRNYEGAIENFEKCEQLGSNEIQCYYLRGLSHYYLANGTNGHCELAWDDLNESLRRTADLSGVENIVADIQNGLEGVIDRCPQFGGRGIPTLEPTIIPPTPIGGG